VNNIACDYDTVLREGLEGRRARLLRGIEAATPEQRAWAGYAARTLDAVEAFTDRYADLEEKSGMGEHAAMLRRVVRAGAATLAEAMQLFRILHFVLWASGSYHNTVGRFDQYLYSYFISDLEKGILDEEEALALIEDFFLSFNRDSDLYFGIMWGDNGQSLVLGGCKPDGSPAVNPLTYMAIEASLALHQIDPKLNLRCDGSTPEDLYELGTRLTRAGMGFPQYSNDSVVIPGLVNLGYDLADARNYVAAACWEFIVPGVAMDITNIGAVSLAEVTRETILEGLAAAPNFDALKELWAEKLRTRAREINDSITDLYMEPAPYLSVLMSNCLEEKRDISLGAKYNNFGFHGTGFSSAVDQMAAVEKLVFRDKTVSKERLLEALETDFARDGALKYMLRHDAPKLGREPEVKIIAEELIDLYADSLAGLKNARGGVIRGGTGSAMYYLWHAEHLGATADGRGFGENLPANFSPSLFLSDSGVFSVITGFTEKNISRLPNGGPFTLELHDTVFHAPDSIEKVAKLVRAFIRMGGHQIQLNAVSTAKMRDAQLHPEKHADLVVRVWGWSGHFVELEKEYQDQIISRTEFAL
jgi:formate C-acetyltransferase